MTVLAHVSDLHLDGTDRAHSRAEKVIAYIRNLPTPVDAVLVTGDIADHGSVSEYEAAAKLLDLPVPVLPGPGNHDTRDAFRQVLLGQEPSFEPINSVHHVGGLAILMCDSTIPGEDEGRLSESTQSWMSATLDTLGGIPALLAFHHPPVPMRHPLADRWPLLSPGGLETLVRSHSNIVAVLTGHAHTAAASGFAGRPLIVAPATTWTLQMPWEGESAANLSLPPGLAFHVIEDRQIITHFRVVL
jgi:3',5'-cyclic AMP phosphodiesterase CpdA